jgi:hypothetical protein
MRILNGRFCFFSSAALGQAYASNINTLVRITFIYCLHKGVQFKARGNRSLGARRTNPWSPHNRSTSPARLHVVCLFNESQV